MKYVCYEPRRESTFPGAGVFSYVHLGLGRLYTV